MTWTTGSIASSVLLRLENVPTANSGDVGSGSTILWYANDAVQEVVNFTGASDLTSGSIPDKYAPIITNLTSAYTLSRMANIGITTDTTLGEFSVSAGNANRPEYAQMAFLLSRANDGMRMLGRKMYWRKTV